jgi:hypothetical protein
VQTVLPLTANPLQQDHMPRVSSTLPSGTQLASRAPAAALK